MGEIRVLFGMWLNRYMGYKQRVTVLKVVEVTTTSFTVVSMQILTRQHRHQVGTVGTFRAGGVAGHRDLNLYNSSGVKDTVGGVGAQFATGDTNVYTDNYVPNASEPSMSLAAVDFDWIAMEKTQ